MSYIRIFIFSLLPALFTQSAYSADYFYQHSYSSNIYSSATAACDAYYDETISQNRTGRNRTFERNTSTEYKCRFEAQFNSGNNREWYPFTTYIVRFGDSCPTGQTLNTATGSCDCPAGQVFQGGQCGEENPCTAKLGQSQAFTKSGSSGDGYGTVVGGFVAGVQSACFGGCAVSTVDQKCTGRVSGLYTCRGTAYYSGQTCATTGNSTEVQDNTSQLPLPNPQTISEEKPCVYSQDGDKQVCQSAINTEKEGQFCGEVNGVKKCVDSKPTKNGITIDTKVQTDTKPDGSKVITKTDTATKTECKGANECKSTSTTTTTTTNVDANGNTTGVSGSCTGEACPDKNTNPDGDGDGFGDCTGDDCGEGAGGSFNTPEFEEVGTIAETTSAFMDRVGDSPILSTVSSIGLDGQGSCSMGSTSTSIGTISLATVCDNSHWLDPLYFIFLAIHALAAVRVSLSA